MSLSTPALLGYIAFVGDPAIFAPGTVLRPVATTDPTWNGLLASINMNAFQAAAGVVQVRLGPPALTAALTPALPAYGVDPNTDAWRYAQTPASGSGTPVPALTPSGAVFPKVTLIGPAALPVLVTLLDANTWQLQFVAAPGVSVHFSLEAMPVVAG